jgi:hypothetical protein
MAEIRFANNQIVTVTNPDHPLVGKTGIVWRLRMADDGAWVAMNDPLPDHLAAFPKGDARRDHIILYPEETD